ncbi:MAG: hypothetical protein NC099_01240 [Corallococcus sp.]|nr:hypothetical protein [Bacillota bacterium]MCM1533259.1 hypothetical protein [Corallococcus sp.]
MKVKFRLVAVIICAMICIISFSACVNDVTVGQSELLGEPKTVERVKYADLYTDGYKAFKNSVEAFASDFAAYSYADYDKQDNFAVSPISVYMALALASQCANGDTRAQLLDALGVTFEQLQTHFSTLYRSLAVEQTTGLVKLSNSVWVNDGTGVKQDCIRSLSDDFYAYSYSADFKNNNAEANKAVRAFVKEQTNGLIDKDFELSDRTLFALINSLYLKTIWNDSGRDLPFADGMYDFTAKDGSVKNVQLLQGDYIRGRAVEFDTYSTFYTATYDGYKIKFILPKDGNTIEQVFTSQNINAVNSVSDYSYLDEAENTGYYTRVLFPEYKCAYDGDIKDVLCDKFGIDLFFKDPGKYSPACDFSALSDEECYCAKIRHVTDLNVNRKGIEGAAVTVIGIDAATAMPPAKIVRQDFVVNKAFGFIITDSQDVMLFSGLVNNV